MMMTLLIPGPKSVWKDINVFLRPVIDELKELWNEGVVVCDAVRDENFWMQVALLMTVNDYPTRSSLSGWSGQGYLVCYNCNDATPSMAVMSKTCYFGHRQ